MVSSTDKKPEKEQKDEHRAEDDAGLTTEQQQLSRGQRKRQAKREQYLRREQMVLASLKLKRADEQKKRIDGLDAIKEALMATVSTKEEGADADSKQQHRPNLLKSNKSRKRLLEKEAAQLNLVLQHPSFNADPFSTMREHLQNTLAKDAEQQKKQAQQYSKERTEKQEKKKAIKKENGIKKKKKKFRATRSKAR